MALKNSISSPLEAGPSVLDTHRLPPPLALVLEYASRRLAGRSLHLTLVVVRRDYQLPSAVLPHGLPPSTTPPTTTPPPSAYRFSLGPVTALKQLVRTGSRRARDRSSSQGSQSSDLSMPCSLSPSSPPPMTPGTAPSATTDWRSPATQGFLAVRLLHAPDLPARARKILASTLARVDQKSGDRASWLSSAASPATCGLPDQLFNSSTAQNEVLFSSKGLTLVSLDRLYSIKSALSSYSRTLSLMRLEDAVDELRRFVLAGNGAKVTTADLLRSYDWLSVTSAALCDLDCMYRRAYGGPEQVGAISGMPNAAPLAIAAPEPVLRSSGDAGSPGLHPDMIGIAVTTTQPPCKAPSPRGPALKLRTDFDPKPPAAVKRMADDDEEDGGDLTARPHSSLLRIGFNPFDQPQSAGALSPDRGFRGPGPLTPNGYDDISPVTRGEWGFLMVDNALQWGRTVAVETC